MSATSNHALINLYQGGAIARRRRRGFWFSGSRGGSLLAFAVVSIAFLFASPENRYGGALVSSGVFFLVQCFLPNCRPVPGKLFCPWNWALFVFFLQLVLLPLSVLLVGPSLGALPFLPSDRAIDIAMIINTIAFVAFCGSYQYFSHRSESRCQPSSLENQGKPVRKSPSLVYIALNGITGLIGFFLAFGTLSKVAEYFSDPAGYLRGFASVSDKLGLVIANYLRPFLGICVVMLWCHWLDRKRVHRTRRLTGVVTSVAILAACFSNATFNYNRGSLVVPLVAMLAVIVSGPIRVPRGTIVSAGAIVLLVLSLLPFYGAYRSSNFTGRELLKDPSVRNVLAEKVEVSQMFQVYGGAPQFLGFFLEAGRWGDHPQWGRVLVSSALAPFPIVGKPFRENSGTAIYNRLIYGMIDAEDQIAPFQGEIFLDFNLAGVLAGFCALGWMAWELQFAFVHSQSSFEMFCWQYFAVWIFFLIFGSMSVVTQIFISSCWPFYVYFLYRALCFRPMRVSAKAAVKKAWGSGGSKGTLDFKAT